MARSEKTTVIEDLLQEKRDEILRIAEKHGARNVRVFGSVAMGDATDTSDIDLLVDTAEKTSPWFPAGLVEKLEEVLGRRVDVVTPDGLYWLLRRRILKEARPM
jgi:predicted nucleotidyltransferase